MEISDIEFEKIIHENKSTIYSVCYMFSEDADEVDDLFQEVLINLWKDSARSKARAKSKIGFGVSVLILASHKIERRRI